MLFVPYKEFDAMKRELKNRMERFIAAMNKQYPDWEMCAITGAVNIYYFTATIQDGVLLVTRSSGAVLWVRRSYERALIESEFEDIRRMKSFRDIAKTMEALPETLYLDMSETSMQWYSLFTRHMPFKKTLPLDGVLLKLRAVKSEYEIGRMQKAGSIADRLLREEAPLLFKTGMSEAQLGAELLSLFIKNGHHGLSRFAMNNAETLLGHVGFGKSPLYPSAFNGASGVIGLHPAAPVMGSPDVKLKKGDMIYMDLIFGIDGYNIDKTIIYSYGEPQPEYVNEAHQHCIELQQKAVSMMKPGVKSSEIYTAVCDAVKSEYLDCFMGVSGNDVGFIGHGVGLYVDEWPVITYKLDDVLESGMTIAVEPKIGLEGIGMVGDENTYLITDNGAQSLTGSSNEIKCTI